MVPGQVVVYDPKHKHSGEELVELANQWAELDEVVFATPNFVSQFRREALPSLHPQQWHLRNLGRPEAKKGEDVNILGAWKKTRGKYQPSAILLTADNS